MDFEHEWIPPISPKQLEILNSNTEADGWKRFIYVDGGRLSSKSIGVGHRVMRHLWETPGARFGIVAKTYKNAKRGAWADMLEIVIPEWLNSKMVGTSGMPIEYTSSSNSGPGPASDTLTRTPYFRIRNWWGGESECLLYSLDNDDEVEAKLRSTRFSGLWFSELQNFQNRKVFNDSILNLRMVHLKPQQHMWIADGNPPESGKDSWQYKLWYEEIKKENHSQPHFQRSLKLVHVRLEDNPYLHPEQIETLKGTYADDPAEYDRNVNGIYVKGHGTLDKHFADLIIPELLYVDPAIDVDPATEELFTGWDIGAKNNAFVILERRNIGDVSVWCVLDECVTLGEKITTSEFASMCYEKMIALQNMYRRHFKWTHWSDDTALNAYRGGIGGFDAAEVSKATGGKVDLQAAAKPDGSIRDGIRILRRLIREQRLFVGKNCPNVIQFLEELSIGRDLKTPVEDSDLKHTFDATRYPIYMEEREFLLQTSTIQSRIPPIHV